MSDFPSGLKNDCIVSSAIEMRFERINSFELMVSDIIQFLKTTSPDIIVENTSIMNLPEVIRITDNSFKFKPWKKLTCKDYTVLLGPCVLVVDLSGKYLGWESLKSFFTSLIGLVSRSINTIDRLGLRYIDFFKEFKEGFFDDINIKLNKSSFNCDCPFADTTIRTKLFFRDDNIKSNLIVSSDGNRLGEKGSVIDFDVYIDDKFSIEKIHENLNILHNRSLKVFFDLIGEKILKHISG